MIKHVNIPIFIPHLGCPNQCVFCNQRSISGVKKFDPHSVVETIENALSTIDVNADVEIAFFGGSFTGIDYSLMIDLLKIGNEYIKQGRVSSLRCSTRPDYINRSILGELKKYGVKTIELGLQSFNEDILLKSKRGHTKEDEISACSLIKEYGFELVGQMMIGLPGADIKSEIETAEFIASCGASYARIYPTVVFHETELCEFTKQGLYTPLTVDEAVKRTAEVMEVFLKTGIKIIRVGLCASDNLVDEKTFFAGPNHPALGELVENEIYFNRIKKIIGSINLRDKSILTVFVPKGTLSKAIGQKKRNKCRLISEYVFSKVDFKEDSNLKAYEVRVLIEERKEKCT